MLLVLLGPPGAGKGTQAERISEDYKLTHISTGDILRTAVKKETVLGKKAKEMMEKGKLVSDDIVIEIVRERIKEPDCEKGVLLDGFPRSVLQAKSFESVLRDMGLRIDAAIHIYLDEEEVISRLTGRRVCRDCGASYHIKFNPPSVRNVCDQCGGELYQREDDTLETVRQRLNVYNEHTEPLIDYYDGKGILKNVDGNRDIDEVYKEIKEKIDLLF